jgi:N-acetylglucosaminyldiphosphoundecaprenol N-acetyl-beta-D-mannosaminyltransferase
VEFLFPPYAVTVNMPTRATLMGEVARRFARGEGFALATINLDHLVKLRRDPVFAAAYAAQDLVVADGNPIVWLSRLAKKPVELVPGSDLILPLAKAAASAQVPVVLLGATDATLSDAADGLQARVPGLTVAACIAPPMGFDPDGPGADEVLDRVGATGARLVFLALGAPKQERLAARGRALLPGVGFASIGAGLDFIAGSQTRAPAWVRAVAMEWLWRMMTNPRRLARRYADCALILPGQAVAALRQRE